MPRPVALLASLLALASASPARAAGFVYVGERSPLLYLKGTAAPPVDWQGPGASEAGWTASPVGFGIGYGDGDDRTILADMANGYLTVYVRSHFQVGAERAGLTDLSLRARYDDGFVAYLNGVEVGRASVPAGSLTQLSPALDHEVTAGDALISIDPALLVDGDNVLAVEVHNASIGSSDLSFIPELAGADALGPGARIVLGPYVQEVARDSLTLCWETDVAAPSRVAYGPTPAWGQIAESSTVALRHEIPLTGLQPGSTVHYRIESAAGVQATGSARTEPGRTAPLRVAAFGDTRSNPGDHLAVVTAILGQAPDLALHSGDLVASSTAAEWTNFFGIESSLLSRTLLLPAIGNHEGDAVLYREKFVLPTGSPGGERYYLRRFAQVGVVTLDEYDSAYDAASPQYAFVRDSLAALAADPGIRFIFVQLHQGPYSSGSHGSNTTIRSAYGPLFQQNKVAIVFSGHDHDYERSTANGVKYVVTGGGGAPLYSVPGDTFTEAKSSTLHYCLMEIDGATLHFRALTPDGKTTVDEFWLGQGISECVAEADCASRTPGTCAPPDVGAWRCVNSACLYDCARPVPPGPDAGVDAGLDAAADAAALGDSGSIPAADASGPADAALASDSGSTSGDDASLADAQTGPGAVASSCGCGAAGSAGAGPSAIAALGMLALFGRRRRQ